MDEVTAKKVAAPSMFYRMIGLDYRGSGVNEQKEIPGNGAYRLLVFTEGEGRLTLNEFGYRLVRGKCFITTPNMEIGIESGNLGLVYYEILFEIFYKNDVGFTSSQEQQSPSFPYVGELECSPFFQFLEWVKELYSDCSSETNDELTLFDQQLRFQMLLRHIFKQNSSASIIQGSRQAVETTIELLHQDYDDVWTVDRMAAMANVGRGQYTRLFKEMTGQVPLTYLSDIRMDKAKQLLQATDDRLFDVAQSVGFGNEFYFNRRFKQTVGLSPGQYRRHYREDIRVFAPFLEDFMLALGITPLLQCSLVGWGTPSYLGLNHIPTVELSDKYSVTLPCKPDFIMVDCGFSEKWGFETPEKEVPLYHISSQGEDWRQSLQTVADLLGRGKHAKVDQVISEYERKADSARKALRQYRDHNVAFLRVSENEIQLYAGPDKGYTGPILYRDLELTPHPLVKQLTSHARKVALTPELLAQLDADLLFVTYEILEINKKKRYANYLLKSLPAVRHRRIIEVDFLNWMSYGILSHRKKIDDVMRALV